MRHSNAAATSRGGEEHALAARDAAELLYRHGVGGLVVTALAASTLVAMLPGALMQSGLMSWLGVILLILAARALDLFDGPRRRAQPGWNGRAEIRRWTYGVLATAVCWMLFPLLFFHQLGAVERTTMAIIMSAMAGGSATVLAAELPLAIVYCAALLLPGSAMFLLTPGRENLGLGVLGIVFSFVMAAASKVTHDATMSAIRLNRANGLLMQQMERERQRTEDANAELLRAQAALHETLETLEDRIKARTADLEHEVHERERYSRQLAQLASTDSLTGLSNRSTLTARLASELRRADDDGRGIAVLFLDLDKFKEVNDVQGHDAGDLVLRSIAHRVSSIMPANAIAARWGGDEFVFVLTHPQAVSAAVDIGLLLRRSVGDPIVTGSERVRVDATIGIALFPDHGRTPDELIRAADMAMYAGKEIGRGQVRVFDPSLADSLRNRHHLGQALHEAVASDALRLEFQPIFTSRTRRCQSLEALLRWDHPRRGAVSPSEFIPLAERSGDIVDIGRWVLARACAAAAAWPGAQPPAVSVNVSVAQLVASDLRADVCDALAGAGLAAHRLQLEVTESLFASDQERIIPTLAALRTMGVRIALDDFGTGFSSLGSLRSLPIDVIKIDRSFVAGMEGEAAPIINAIRSVCRALDLELIAEGVETANQAAMLRSMDVHFLQGFFLARPLPAESVPAWLRDGAGAPPSFARSAGALPQH